MKKIPKLAVIIGAALFAFGMAPAAVHAGVGSQRTILTFNQAVRIPGQVLNPGTYDFVRIDNGQSSDVNLIQVFNHNSNRIVATEQTITVDRKDPSGSTVLTLSQAAPGHAPALVDWFYPGSLIGHEFLYSPTRETQINQSPQTILATNSNGTEVVSNLSGQPS
jgi:hypothetical protein